MVRRHHFPFSRRLLWCCDAWTHRYRLISIRKSRVFWSQDSTLNQRPSPNFFYVRKRNAHLNHCLRSFPLFIVKQWRQVQGRGWRRWHSFQERQRATGRFLASFSIHLKWKVSCVYWEVYKVEEWRIPHSHQCHILEALRRRGRQGFRAHLTKVRLCGDLTLVTVFCDWLSRPNKKSQIQKVCGW